MPAPIRCRVCRKSVRPRADETVMAHGSCEGSMQPPLGDPPCARCGPTVGRVSWPVDLAPAADAVSTLVCDSPRHQREAAEWVRSVTGHDGVFVEMRRVSR